MKIMGLLGGMSWESSAEYYRIINETTKSVLGDKHSYKSLMYTVDFAEIETMQHRGDWTALTQEMVKGAKRLKAAGAEFIVICTNTMHKMADDVSDISGLPLVHIADVVGQELLDHKLTRVGLIGTRFTMEEDFYKKRIYDQYDIDVIVPDDEDMSVIHSAIYDELVQGIISDETRKAVIKVINGLVEMGAQGIILGCTELPLLIKETDVSIPVFDTMTLHAKKAVHYGLSQ